MTAQRNVLFLIADDWSRIADCYGNSVVRTPRIDAFAREGTVFEQAFCTSPSCAVSRACILTGYHSHTHGQYGHCHGIHGFSTHPHITSTPSSLKEHGYATACIGKKHVEPPSVYPFDFEPEVNARNGVELARAARDFWAAHPDQPFYMHVGFTDPHRAGRGFGNERPYSDVPETQYSPDDVVVPPYLPDVPDVRADLAEYYQAVSRFDFGVGCLLDALEESGRADETLVIVTTDHAMPFPGAKASFFDSGHHCPFILRAPGITTPGTRSQSLINWTDVRPTLHDWCGVPVPEDLPGRSLLPGTCRSVHPRLGLHVLFALLSRGGRLQSLSGAARTALQIRAELGRWSHHHAAHGSISFDHVDGGAARYDHRYGRAFYPPCTHAGSRGVVRYRGRSH